MEEKNVKKILGLVLVGVMTLSLCACGGKNIDPSLFDGKFSTDSSQIVFHGNKCTEYYGDLGSATYKFNVEDKYFITENGDKHEFYFDSNGDLNMKIKDKFVKYKKIW